MHLPHDGAGLERGDEQLEVGSIRVDRLVDAMRRPVSECLPEIDGPIGRRIARQRALVLLEDDRTGHTMHADVVPML